MANVTAAMVKQLRDATGAGMMDCKKALVEADGDMDKAIDAMRKSGALKAAKKATRTAAEGVIAMAHNDKQAVMVELNTETDFAAKNEEFRAFAQKAADIALSNNVADIESLKQSKYDDKMTVAEALTALISKIGENMNLRRMNVVKGDVLGLYLHSNLKIGVAAVLKGGDAELGKDVAMHICASKPDFIRPEDVAAEVVERERQVQIDIAMQSGKPKEIAEKMVEGRLHKFTAEISLTAQPFVKDPNVTVGDMLKAKNADVVEFVRLEVGAGIEKKEDNFAAEVQAQIAAAQK